MAALQNLETRLDDIFGKNAPKLPTNGRKLIVDYLPWLSLGLGLIALWAAYALWQWAHVANSFVDYANQLSTALGGSVVATDRLGLIVWLSLAVLTVEAVLYIAAFPALRARKKSGWNLLFYALLINVVYGVISLFSDYGGFGNLLSTIIGSAIGLYFLFQIRPSYSPAGATQVR